MTKKSRLTGYDLVKATSDVKKKIQILESLIAEKEDEVSELSILFQNTKIALNIFLGKYNSIVGLLYIKLDKLELKVKKYGSSPD